MKKAMLAVGMLTLILTSCATPKRALPGRPEVTIAGATVDQARNYLLNVMTDRGYTAVQAEGNLLVFDRDAGLGPSIFLGSLAHPKVLKRTRWTLIQNPEGVRVIYSFFVVSHASGEDETHGGWPEAKKLLDEMELKLSKKQPL